jgi:septal ring-binding cell division protein DamX
MKARVLFSTIFGAAIIFTAGCSNSARIGEESSKDWICTADANNEWDCQWRYSGSGEAFKPSNQAGDESRTNSSAVEPPAAAEQPSTRSHAATTVTGAGTASAAVVIAADGQQATTPLSREILANTPAEYYVVQLASFNQPSSAAQYIEFYRQQQPLSLVSASGKILLLENVYPTYSSAREAVSQYPSRDTIDQPWIRKVGALNTLIAPAS